MDFFNNKIKKYQEKKLDEILFKIQFHQSTKKELKEKMDKLDHEDLKLRKDILYHDQMAEIWIANEKKLPRVMSVQNGYNLVNRVFDIVNSEVSIRENCGLLAYSLLAGGRLSGKYINGKRDGDWKIHEHGKRQEIYLYEQGKMLKE